MGQEYFINSQTLEDKIRNLLPSQGGAGAGVDLSASTTVIPIVDLTESAEGSNVRQDLQTALSLDAVSVFEAQNSTVTAVNNTGYYRVFGACSIKSDSASTDGALLRLNDGVTDKDVLQFLGVGGVETSMIIPFDFVIFLKAGDFLQAISTTVDAYLRGCTRQIADIDGNLVNP